MTEDKQTTFQILFTSDLHGSFRTYNYAMCQEVDNGLSRLAPLMKKERDNFSGTTIICDCGDSIQGNGTGELVKNRLFQPYPLFAAFDAIGYDMVVLGNHEFNFGFQAMMDMFEGYKGVKLGGNVLKDGAYLEGFEAYHVVSIPDGPRVAFIGMVSPNITIWDKKHTNDAGIRAENAAQKTQELIQKIKTEDIADLFVLLGHMDEISELDTPGSGALEVVEANPELVVFLGAHFHKIKGKKEDQCVLAGSVKFAENLCNAGSFGRVQITATLKEGKWVVINKTGVYDKSDVKTDIICPPEGYTEEDEEVNRVTQEAHEELKRKMQEESYGYLPDAPLLRAPEIKGTHEGILKSNPLTSLIARVMLDYSKADIAACTLNSDTANCEDIVLTPASISRLYVYDNNTLYVVIMTGAQLLQWMEWSYAYFGTTLDPGVPAVNPDTDLIIPYGTRKIYLFDQFFGIDYTVDLTKPIGKRIQILGLSDGRPFMPETFYSVATTNYRATTNLLMNSNNGIFKPGEKTAICVDAGVDGSKNMLDMIAEYIAKQKDQTIYAVSENNWKFVNLNWNQEWRDLAIRLINNGEMEYHHTESVTISKVQDYLRSKKILKKVEN